LRKRLAELEAQLAARGA